MATNKLHTVLVEAADAHRRGDVATAEKGYRKVLARDPRQPDALNLLAVICADRGEIAKALSLFDRAIAANPASADILFNRANVLSRPAATRAELERAAESYRRSIDLNPGHADARTNLGSTLKRLGDLDAAISVFQAMVAAHPIDVRGHYNLGLCYLDRDQPDLARTALENALKLVSASDQIQLAMCDALSRVGDSAGAVAHAKRAVNIAPQSHVAWTSLGTALSEAGQWAEAQDAYDRALAIDANHVTARVNRGLVRLRTGVSAEHWADYALRVDDPDFAPPGAKSPLPQWRGEPLDEKHILIWGDQGIGDQILFGSMLRDVAVKARAVTFACDPRLVDLFGRSHPGVRCVARDNFPIAGDGQDLQSSLIDLGQWVRPRMDRFPNRRGYLRPLTDQPRNTDSDNRLRIGMSWRSFRTGAGREKSIDLPLWRPLLQEIDADWICLQYGPIATEVADLRASGCAALLDDTTLDKTNDLDGLANLMSTLDLVVTVSNSTAHLAGALGIPTWVIVPNGRGALWYWFDRGEYSPWYPTVRLFRSGAEQTLAECLSRIGQELNTLTAGSMR